MTAFAYRSICSLFYALWAAFLWEEEGRPVWWWPLWLSSLLLLLWAPLSSSPSVLWAPPSSGGRHPPQSLQFNDQLRGSQIDEISRKILKTRMVV